MEKIMANEESYKKSCGNIFEDLGLENPKERLIKAEIAMKINEAIEKQKLTQQQAADMLGIDQPKVSALSRGRLKGFTIERLCRLLNHLEPGYELELVKKQKIC